MKILALIAVGSVLVSSPVVAGVGAVHRTSLAHEGTTVAVSYEPRAKTSLRQSGLGPRSSAVCLWKTEISVERRLADADGQPIAAFTRIVGEPMTVEGGQPGYCANIESRHAMLGGGHERIRALVAEAAETDTPHLRSELASLGTLGRAPAR